MHTAGKTAGVTAAAGGMGSAIVMQGLTIAAGFRRRSR